MEAAARASCAGGEGRAEFARLECAGMKCECFFGGFFAARFVS